VIYLWSDTHFNHEGVIRYCGRPFASIDEMNRALIGRWNGVVRDTDTIYLLGDFAFSHKAGWPLEEIYSALRGHKHLVIGNHDEKNPKVLALPWESKADLLTLRENGVRAIACHYPMETWKGAHRGYLMVHGHSHGSLKRKLPHRYDVGCDVFPEPVTLQRLAEVAAAEVFQATDHHGADV
jgi:calcineurin-like phosphoesterase family protein